jgi:hypothetical protein
MNFEIAIPSYQRVEKLQKQTLAYLRTQQIDLNKVTVFVKNQEEYDLYTKQITDIRFVISNNRSLAQKRTFINNYYPEGTRIVCFDDDIKRIKFLNKEQQLLPFINRMFELCEQENTSIWGIYPVNQTNMFYCKDRVAIGLFYIVANFYGFINKKIQFPDIGESEDLWLSLYLYQTEGKLIRYEGACPDTQYRGKGGYTEARKTLDIAKIKQEIVAEYPTLCKYVIRKNGRPDVVFNRGKRRYINLYPHIQPILQLE